MRLSGFTQNYKIEEDNTSQNYKFHQV